MEREGGPGDTHTFLLSLFEVLSTYFFTQTFSKRKKKEFYVFS